MSSDVDRVAGPDTPLIRNCWYVAAFGVELANSLLTRRILSQPVVLYRTPNGTPVALHDRCPHRSLPLHKGSLEGDSVRCGYHGLLFNPAGSCLDAPPVGKALAAMTVRSYPIVERGPLLWIWLGDLEPDTNAIPRTDWLEDSQWSAGYGSMTIESNYVGLQENLLDLSHFTFLHPDTLGTPEYANAPYTVVVNAESVCVERFVAECSVPGLYAATGLGTKRISRRTLSEFLSPALHCASVDLTPLEETPGTRAAYTAKITHFVTPRDLNETHYFFAIARDFALQDASAGESMRAAALKAFTEDADALQAITENQRLEPNFVEKSMKSDRAGVAMRRILKRLADREMLGAEVPAR